MDPFLIEQFLVGVVLSLPSLGAFVVGMVLSLVFWRRAPVASYWGFLGFAWMFLMYLVQCGWHAYATELVVPGFGFTTSTATVVVPVVNVIVACNSVADTNIVVTFAPAIWITELEINPVPITSTR